MHDVLEGALQYETKELLKYFILEEKIISIMRFNNRLQFFSYGYTDSSNKPSVISLTTLEFHDHNLKQNVMYINIVCTF